MHGSIGPRQHTQRLLPSKLPPRFPCLSSFESNKEVQDIISSSGRLPPHLPNDRRVCRDLVYWRQRLQLQIIRRVGYDLRVPLDLLEEVAGFFLSHRHGQHASAHISRRRYQRCTRLGSKRLYANRHVMLTVYYRPAGTDEQARGLRKRRVLGPYL